MAAAKVELEVAFKDLQEKAKSAPGLSADQTSRINQHNNQAQLALDTKDWKNFQKHINAVVDILKGAVGASKDVSDAMKKAVAVKDAISKQINELKDKKAEIDATITKEGKLKKTKAQSLYAAGEQKNVKDISGQVIEQWEEVVKEYISRLTKDAKHMTNEDAQKAGFQDRNSALAALRQQKVNAVIEATAVRQRPGVEADLAGANESATAADNEVNRLTESAEKSTEEIVKLYQAIDELGRIVNEKVTEIRNEEKVEASGTTASASTKDLDIKPVEKQSSALGKAFKQLSLYTLAWKTLKKALREGLKTIKDLDKYLTEQAMVTGKTREQTYGLLKEYQGLSKQLGATTKEVAQVATQYMRQGKTEQEALTLTKAAISAAKVAGISATESVNYLTTALNGFQLSAQDAMKVSDRFAAVAAQSATSYDEIATALSKVASQANLAGMSIDYTTALLAKGIETTREAPETIGTALKTIIARMREMSDYGETLEDGMDINNVETQLAYIGIALRNEAGELRSTEEVLDELGKKWDTLNSNQQAAVAKALAGTRQQSRLIAMMSDYERVTELQQISERSAGATTAQMATYLQGMEAALNNVAVAWEKIVTNITDSNTIIDLINFVSEFLDVVAEFLNTDFGLELTLTTIATLTAATLGNKLQEIAASKIQQAYDNQTLKIKLKARAEELKILIAKKENEKETAKQAVLEKKGLKLAALKAKAEREGLSDAEVALQTKQIEAEANTEIAGIDAEIAELKSEQVSVDGQLIQMGATQVSQIGSMASGLSILSGGMLSLVTGSQEWLIATTLIGIALKAVPATIALITAAQKKQNKEIGKGTFLAIIKAFSSGGIPGVITGIAIATAIASAVGLGIAAVVKASVNNKKDSQDQFEETSAQIYNLTKQADSLSTIESKFDAIDQQVLKTNDDLKEMNNLLASAADSMADVSADEDKSGLKDAKKKQNKGKDLSEKDRQLLDSEEYYDGKSEKDFYNAILASGNERDARNKLEEIEEKKRAEIDNLYETQRRRINNGEVSLDPTDKHYQENANFVYAATNYTIYKEIDKAQETLKQALKEGKAGIGITEESLAATEKLLQNITDEMSLEDNLALWNDPDKISDFINQLALIKDEVKDINGDMVNLSIAEIMGSDDYSILDKTEVYKKAIEELPGELQAAFKKAYNEFELFAQLSTEALTYIDETGIDNKKINDLGKAITDMQSMGLEGKREGIISGLLTSLEENTNDLTGVVDLQSVINSQFGSFVDNLDRSSEEYKKVIKTLENLIGDSLLNLGQNTTKLQNQISKFYETTTKWTSMSQSEKDQFITDNLDLFGGEKGEQLLRAFETNDFNEIENALKNSEVLANKIQNQIKDIERQLAIEEFKAEKDQNKAVIEDLKRQAEMLRNTQEVFKASLELRLEQEKSQLDIYKDYLSKQQEALEKSLNKRKDAYQKYFDAINQNEEDEDYEEQATMLATNLSKLASSDNASSKQQSKELEKQLEELEKERLKTLRERAQEAVLNNLDTEVEEINEKFDKLLESNQNLLAAMLNDQQDKSSFVANMISSSIDGKTALEAQDFLSNDFAKTFGSFLTRDELTTVEKSISEILNLNVNGGNVQITESQQQSLYKAIMDALKQIGYN